MAKPCVVDHSILSLAHRTSDNLRNTMALCRQLRGEGVEVGRDTLMIVEGLLFIVSIELDDFASKVRTRFSDYRDLADAAIEAVDDLVADQIVPANLIVFTGSYRPRPANDCCGGAA